MLKDVCFVDGCTNSSDVTVTFSALLIGCTFAENEKICLKLDHDMNVSEVFLL